MSKIPQFVSRFNNGTIPEQVANTSKEDKESQSFLISFERYNNKECEISDIVTGSNKKIVINLKYIDHLSSTKDFRSKNIKIKPVSNEGDYQKLFNKLDPQTQLNEIILSDTDRLFYFTIINKFYIVAITHKHYEYKKNRK